MKERIKEELERRAADQTERINELRSELEKTRNWQIVSQSYVVSSGAGGDTTAEVRLRVVPGTTLVQAWYTPEDNVYVINRFQYINVTVRSSNSVIVGFKGQPNNDMRITIYGPLH